MKKYLTMIAGVLLLTACQNDGADDVVTGYVPSTQAISFDAATESLDNVTRASGAINITDDDLTKLGNLRNQSMGVFASYTGKLTYENSTVTPNFMYNQKLEWDATGSKWTYAPVKYWPNEVSEYVSFFAYAPYAESPTDDGNGGIIDISDNYVQGDPWLNYRLAKYPWPKDADGTTTVTPNQVDLLYGVKFTAGTPDKWEPWTNVNNWNSGNTAKDISYKVEFTMKHALASIGNAITIQTSTELNSLIENYSKVYVYGIKIEYKNLTNKARLVLNPGISASGAYANWKELVSGELTTNRTYYNIFATPMEFDGSSTTAVNIPYLNGPATGAPANITEGDGLFYIPMQIQGTEKATAKVTLYYRVEILANGTYLPAITDASNPIKDSAEASSTFELKIDGMEGMYQGIALTLGKDYDLMHEVWTLGGTASEPSYVRKH